MSFPEAIRSGLQNYATFSGRSSRSAYWWWSLFAFLCVLASTALPGLGELIVALVLFPPGISVTVRRLHDVDRSGWDFWWSLVPVFGAIYLIYLFVQPGSGPNEYGPEENY